MRKTFIAAVAALTVVSTAAGAAVAVTDGVGFVGKGDVQLAFGWNNAAAQKNANAVSFTYEGKTTYDVTCEWDTVTGGPRSKTIHHDITIPRHTSVFSTIAADPRKTGQYTGYNLNGFGSTVTTGTTPEVGAACPGNNPGEITEVVETSSTGGLFVNFGGTAVALPNTPVLATTI